MVRRFAGSAPPPKSTSRFTMVGAANIEMRGQAANRRKISSGSKPPDSGTTLIAEPRHMRHHVEAGAVAHRRGVQDRIARRGRVHLGRDRRSSPAPARDGSASRPSAGRWCRRCRTARRDRCRRAARPRIGSAANSASIVRAADHDQPFEACRRMRRDLARRAPASRSTRARRNARECSRARARAAWRWPAPPRSRHARCRRWSRDIRRSSWR